MGQHASTTIKDINTIKDKNNRIIDEFMRHGLFLYDDFIYIYMYMYKEKKLKMKDNKKKLVKMIA